MHRTGIVNEATRNAINEAYLDSIAKYFTSPTQFPHKPLRLGDNDEEISKGLNNLYKSDDWRYYYAKPIESAQNFLRAIAYTSDIPKVVPNGKYDKETRNTVLAFQAKHDLPLTGVLDYDTWQEIVKKYTQLKDDKLTDDVKEVFS